jgi:hypothetical protein
MKKYINIDINDDRTEYLRILFLQILSHRVEVGISSTVERITKIAFNSSIHWILSSCN